METEFAPAERLDPEQVHKQSRQISEIPFIHDFLDAIPTMAMVLNECRQIVFANKVFCDFVGASSVEELIGTRQGDALQCIHANFLGKRPGEAVGCIRSDITEGGCGTTLFCRTCGAVRSIVNSQELQALDVQECRMIRGENHDPLDLQVWSRPLDLGGIHFTVFSVMDISNEKRRRALERIFFHDVLNTAGGVKGLADLMLDGEMSEEAIQDLAGTISETADQLIEEIAAQRMLSAAESGDLEVQSRRIESRNLLRRVIDPFHSLPLAQGKKLLIAGEALDFEMTSDPILLRRVLVNLTKNALEAVSEGGQVTLRSFLDDERACFSVHNNNVMPPDVQLQVFSRSFSTKGSGRGLGTYSIKLITERYLKGEVWFDSNEKEGTRFTVAYPRHLT